ncbi:MAG TPA: hypothetical protein VG738_14035 [Chitinophagaceae bacterium]|nr:hypothetical protein [Chitinophagaceae bacterium]
MKKLTREEMKSIKGGALRLTIWKWKCYDMNGAGPYYTCSRTDPTTACSYSSCTNTDVACTQTTGCG